MTQPADNAETVINTFIVALKQAFNPDDTVQPPVGGGSTTVRFIAGSFTPLELWDAHADGPGCKDPLLWVRLVQRYRSKDFPNAVIDTTPCGLPEVIDVEVGVGRCSAISEDGTVDWARIAREAEVSLDDSWRIKLALCIAAGKVRELGHQVGTGTIVPQGPDGGVVAWGGIAHVSL